MSKLRNFVDLCLAGNVLLEEIDDFVDHWHEAPEGAELHDYLGMTEEEYSLWLRVPDSLPYIIKARHDGGPLTNAVVNAYQDMRLAARSNDQSKITRLQKWLESKGELN
ncbi:MAG TPA: hypothetical protein VND95_02490 [Stellaceae bacterium]|nr:hypothetical protein [Stellaceae bacterium]